MSSEKPAEPDDGEAEAARCDAAAEVEAPLPETDAVLEGRETGAVEIDATVLSSESPQALKPETSTPEAADADATILIAQTPDAQTGERRSVAAQETLRGPMIPLESGTVINNMYRVLHALDQGGMGRVFRGEELGTGEAVAIKVILPEMADQLKVGEMFRREARTLRQLHHPAIVRYFAYLAPDARLNLHAIVMGFIEGEKLSDHLKARGGLTEGEVCELFARLADGLKRAHEIGVTHRDLSPDNVMLQDGDITRGVLIDFGIARSSKLRDVTIGNEFAGKLKYVSPEQLGAYGGDADGRSDVYSLGLLMIAALTGQAPQMGDTIVDAVQKRQAVPDLSILPSAFQSLLYRMLQPDPAWRLHDMQAVIDGLAAIGGGGYTTSQPPQQNISQPTVPGLQIAPIMPTSAGFQALPRSAMGILPPVAEVSAALPKGQMRKKRMGLYLTFGIAALGVILAGGAFSWWRSNPLATEEAGSSAAGVLPIAAGTQGAFLAARAMTPCSYATRSGAGGDQLLAYSATGAEFGALAGAWQGRFGSSPEVLETAVSTEQCPALEFAKPYIGSSRAPIELTFEARSLSMTQGIIGTLHGSDGRQNWLAIVAPNGQIFSLTRQLEAPIGDRRRFAFRLPSAQPGVYVVVATASEKASVRVGAMAEGTLAEKLLPLIGRELVEDAGGFATMATLTLIR